MVNELRGYHTSFTRTMSALPQTSESTARIRFQDCDPFNHLNNGRYTDYFLNAREDHLLEQYNFDIYGIATATGRTWVVSTSQIAYMRPAILMEQVVISSQLITYSPKHVEVEMLMWDKDKKEMKALCWMSFVHFDLSTNRSAEHIVEHMELFAQVCLPVEEKVFDMRVKGLRVSWTGSSFLQPTRHEHGSKTQVEAQKEQVRC